MRLRKRFLALCAVAALTACQAPQVTHGANLAASRRDSSPAYYEDLWRTMRVLPGWQGQVDDQADFAVRNRARYEAVEAKTGVPWPAVAAIHRLEGGASWATCLHNGQRWDRRTTLVPAGRGPWGSWEEAAVDALGRHDPAGWTIGATLGYFEQYNGWGYRSKGRHSPYLWSGSLHGVGVGKTLRKYVGDSKYSPSAVSKQVGAALILRAIADRGAWEPLLGAEQAPVNTVQGDDLPLHVGSQGPRVAILQGALNDIGGYGLKADGRLGPKTAAALKATVKVE